MSHNSRNLSDFTITHLMGDRDSLGQYVRDSHEDDRDDDDQDHDDDSDDSDPRLLS